MPYAYLKYIVYRSDSSIAQEDDLLMSTAANSSWEELSSSVTIREDGYVKIYVVNEDPVNVWFDDFSIEHIESPIAQQTDYYPFGLAIAPTQYNRTDWIKNRLNTFQEQEIDKETGWYQFKWRNHQPEIGRFFNIDPLSEKYLYNSTYAFAENKLGLGRELEGLEIGPDYRFSQSMKMKGGVRKKAEEESDKRLAQAGVYMFRYLTPVEDVYGIVTGEDFEGSSYNRFEAAGWALLSIIPGSKAGKIGKATKLSKSVKLSEKISQFSKTIRKKSLSEVNLDVTSLSGKGGGSLNTIIDKTNNLVNHLKPDDLQGAIKDIFGEPVVKGDKVFDHLDEVNNALRGLCNQISSLNNMIDGGKFSDEVLDAAQRLRSNLQNQKDQIQNVLNKARKEADDL